MPLLWNEITSVAAAFSIGSMSSDKSGEGDICRALVEADFTDTALRDRAIQRREANLRSLSEAKDNRSNNMDAADWSGTTKTATGSPKGQRAGAEQYKAENLFWVPPAARWAYLKKRASQPVIGEIVDDAMVAIEHGNPRLKGVLPKDYALPGLDKQGSSKRRLPDRRAVVADLAAVQIERRLNP